MSDKLFGTVKTGAANVRWVVQLIKTSDNSPITGAAHTDIISASYWREGGEPTAITLSALTNINDSYSSGGWKEVKNIAATVTQKALYRLDLPDAMWLTGSEFVTLYVEHTDGYYEEKITLETSVAKQVWDYLTSAATTIGSLGKLIVDNVNATISSRASQTSVDDVPTVAEFNARTLPSADYFDAASDTVTVGTNNDKTGYSLGTSERVKLHTTQPDYAPAKAGDAMALTSGERTTLAGAIWNALASGLTAVGSIGKRLADNVDAKISEVSGGGGTGGSGAYAVTTTVLDADAVPVAGAAVRLRNLTSNDVANTDVDGLATLNKDAGTYTRIVTAAGYEAFTDTVVVDGDETLSDVELTAIVIAPATSDDQCNCYLDAKDAAGTLQGGVTHLFRLSTLPTGDGSSYGPLIEATSEDDETSEDFGRLEVLLKRGATYLMQRGETWENESADQVTVEVPNNAGPFELPNVWSNDN